MIKFLVSIALIVIATGCGSDPVENLLRDTRFETVGNVGNSDWSVIQHAGERSYEWNAEDGLLTARWIGPEVDGHVAQMIRVQGLEGKKLRFSVELSGDTEELPNVPSELTGVQVEVQGMAPGVPRSLGVGPLFIRAGSPPVAAGSFGWMVQNVVFEVPPYATTIRVSIGLGMEGVLRIRNPVLAVYP